MKKLMNVIWVAAMVGVLGACEAVEGIDPVLINQQIQEATFTLEELAEYDGVIQPTTYVAVDGIVYDVTSEFTNGQHQGLQLGGQDVTAVFAQSPHLTSVLSELPIVGVLLGSSTITVPDTTQPMVETSGVLPVYSLEQLAQYTGANGTTAYVAVNGVVYDVTREFRNGMHQGMQLAGTDATQVFASSPHSQAFLAQLPIVGSLEGAPEILASTVPTISNDSSYDGDDDYDDDDDDDDDDYEDNDHDDDDYDDDDDDEDNDND